MKNKLFMAALGLLTFSIAGCGGVSPQKTFPQVDPLDGPIVADFSYGEAEEIFASDGWSNGQPFNAVWKKENVTYSDGKMHLSIKKENAVDGETTYPNTAGEARSHRLYGYGDYEVRFKPSPEVGTVSTFFLYTDKWNKVDGEEQKHDEIDIEFLGRYKNKIQFNYFVGGKGGHEYWYNLGFDATKEFHNYGFRWEKDKITWLVDGKTAYQVVIDKNNPELPSGPCRIMTNYWPCGPISQDWGGKYSGQTNETVDYEWIRASGDTIYADGEEPVEPLIPDDYDWSKVAETDLTFATGQTSIYNVSKNSGVTTVTYSGAKDWANVTANIAGIANKFDTVNLTLKNNSNLASTVRVDVQGSNKVGDTDCLNVDAVAKGHSEIYTDRQWGGSKIELAAQEEVELVVNYDVLTDRGLATNLLIFIDSLQGELKEHEGGSISISKIKFAKLGDWEEPEIPEEPGEFDWTEVETTDLSFTTGQTSIYSIAKNEGVTTVTYSGANNWANVNSDIASVANTYDAVNLTLKNNSNSSSIVRVDVQGTTKVGDTDCLNTDAKAEGHPEVYTDKSWGGSKIELAAQEEVEFVINYDVLTNKGLATNLLVFIDSLQTDFVEHEGGSISISNIKFAKLGDWDDPEPVNPPTPPVGGDAVALPFETDNSYVLDNNKEAVETLNVTYSNMVGSSYENFGAGLGSFIEGKTSFTLTIKNNGEANAKIRIDIKGEANVGNHNCINTSAAAQGHSEIYTDLEWGGSMITVAGGEEVVFTVSFDQTTERGAATFIMFFVDSATYQDENIYSGSLTLSNFIFA